MIDLRKTFDKEEITMTYFEKEIWAYMKLNNNELPTVILTPIQLKDLMARYERVGYYPRMWNEILYKVIDPKDAKPGFFI